MAKCYSLTSLFTVLVLGISFTTVSARNSITNNLNPIEVKAYKFFDSITGDYFPIKGIDYYPRPNAGPLNVNNKDFFTDEYAHIWSRDIPYLAGTGANTVRLYAVDPSANHDRFMCALASYGIYAIIDMASSCHNCAITNSNAPFCYPSQLKTRGQMIINAFSKYTNVLAFSAGNEINHVQRSPYGNAPCQKKFLLDMRTYMASCSSLRQVPIGLVLADSAGERQDNMNYYNCEEDSPFERAEFYGLNVYLHCDGSLAEDAPLVGYDNLKDELTQLQYSIPFVLSEYGCVNPSFPTMNGYEGQRTFYDTKRMYASDMIETIQGGLVFEYSTENENSKHTSAFPFTEYGPQNYGLGYLYPEHCDEINVMCHYEPMPNYYNLAKQLNATDFTAQQKKDTFVPEVSRTHASSCPKHIAPISHFQWKADTTRNLKCPSRRNSKYQCSASIDHRGSYIIDDSMDVENKGTIEVYSVKVMGILVMSSLIALLR